MASLEEQLATLTEWKRSVEDHIKHTDEAVQRLEDERTSALKWGIITLGTAVVGMIGFIVQLGMRHLLK